MHMNWLAFKTNEELSIFINSKCWTEAGSRLEEAFHNFTCHTNDILIKSTSCDKKEWNFSSKSINFSSLSFICFAFMHLLMRIYFFDACKHCNKMQWKVFAFQIFLFISVSHAEYHE